MAIIYDVFCSNEKERGFEINIQDGRPVGECFEFRIKAWKELGALMSIDIEFEKNDSVTLYLDKECCCQLISCLQEAAARVFNI